MRSIGDTLIVTTLQETDFGVKSWVKEDFFYDCEMKKEYEGYFKDLENEKIIINGKFEDLTWVVSNLREDLKIVSLNFPFEFNKNLILALKIFVIIIIRGEITDVLTLSDVLRSLNQLIYISNDFLEENVEDLEDYLEMYIYNDDNEVKRNWINAKKIILRFIYFYQPSTANKYITLVKKLLKDTRCGSRSRDIPPFYDLLTFDEIINDFFSIRNESVKSLQKIFKAIELWWKITTIIPMRIGELIRLKSDCCNYDEEKQGYYMAIPRIKERALNNKESVNDIEYEIQVLRVHEFIFNLINNFKKDLNPNDRFLFSYDLYIYNLGNQRNSKVGNRVKENMGTGGFRRLLRRFYSDIVQEIYKIDVVKKESFRLPETIENELIAIQAADTRHIAVSNLIELGVNPLSISWFCYHDNIKSQDSYSSYILVEAEVKAKLLGRKLASEYNRATDSFGSPCSSLDIIKANDCLKNGGFNVDYGVCTSKHGMFDCEEIDCLFCKHHIPVIDNNNKAIIKEIVRKKKENIIHQLKKIQLTIAILLEELNKSTVRHQDTSFSGSVKDVSLLQTAYNQTTSYKNQLAKIEAINFMIEEKIEVNE